jgi:hypothetical protein
VALVSWFGFDKFSDPAPRSVKLLGRVAGPCGLAVRTSDWPLCLDLEVSVVSTGRSPSEATTFPDPFTGFLSRRGSSSSSIGLLVALSSTASDSDVESALPCSVSISRMGSYRRRVDDTCNLLDTLAEQPQDFGDHPDMVKVKTLDRRIDWCRGLENDEALNPYRTNLVCYAAYQINNVVCCS